MTDPADDLVFLACPLHDGTLDLGAGSALWASATRNFDHLAVPNVISLTAANCNNLLAMALNEQLRTPVAWFAMLHGDVQPDLWWVDTLVDLARRHDADLVSAVCAIKDDRGLTSTAVDNPDDPWNPYCRLTLKQLRSGRLPETFSIDDVADAFGTPRSHLLVNTGCMVFRLDKPWNTPEKTRVWFDEQDMIRWVKDRWVTLTRSEDWNFSRRVAQAGGKVLATTKVRTLHRGRVSFDSHGDWGLDSDVSARAMREGVLADALPLPVPA